MEQSIGRVTLQGAGAEDWVFRSMRFFEGVSPPSATRSRPRATSPSWKPRPTWASRWVGGKAARFSPTCTGGAPAVSLGPREPRGGERRKDRDRRQRPVGVQRWQSCLARSECVREIFGRLDAAARRERLPDVIGEESGPLGWRRDVDFDERRLQPPRRDEGGAPGRSGEPAGSRSSRRDLEQPHHQGGRQGAFWGFWVRRAVAAARAEQQVFPLDAVASGQAVPARRHARAREPRSLDARTSGLHTSGR